MRKFLFILSIVLLLASCATKAPETVIEPEVTEESKAEQGWVNKASTYALSGEQWDALFSKPTEEPAEEVQAEVIEEPIVEEVEAIVVAEAFPEAEEEPVGTTAISITEPVRIKEQPEPSAEILADIPEEQFVVEQEEVILPEMEYEFAGEDYRDLTWLFAEEEVSEVAEEPAVETVVVETIIEPEEEISADIITQLAQEYKELERIDMAEPELKDKVLAVLKENLLYIEIGVIVLLLAVLIARLVKRSKKAREQAQVTPEVDEGEEIDMTPSYYVDPNVAAKKPKEEPSKTESGSEKSREEESESEFKASRESDYGAMSESGEGADYEPEDESGYDSEDESEYEEDPGGWNDGF